MNTLQILAGVFLAVSALALWFVSRVLTTRSRRRYEKSHAEFLEHLQRTQREFDDMLRKTMS